MSSRTPYSLAQASAAERSDATLHSLRRRRMPRHDLYFQPSTSPPSGGSASLFWATLRQLMP